MNHDKQRKALLDIVLQEYRRARIFFEQWSPNKKTRKSLLDGDVYIVEEGRNIDDYSTLGIPIVDMQKAGIDALSVHVLLTEAGKQCGFSEKTSIPGSDHRTLKRLGIGDQGFIAVSKVYPGEEWAEIMRRVRKYRNNPSSSGGYFTKEQERKSTKQLRLTWDNSTRTVSWGGDTKEIPSKRWALILFLNVMWRNRGDDRLSNHDLAKEYEKFCAEQRKKFNDSNLSIPKWATVPYTKLSRLAMGKKADTCIRVLRNIFAVPDGALFPIENRGTIENAEWIWTRKALLG